VAPEGPFLLQVGYLVEWAPAAVLQGSSATQTAHRRRSPPMMEPTEAMRATLPRIEVVHLKPNDPAVPKLRFRLTEGSVDLMKAFSLGGPEGVGGGWEIPPHIALPETTFDARYDSGEATVRAKSSITRR
jgi:hypothetical protein